MDFDSFAVVIPSNARALLLTTKKSRFLGW
jgi:hypothetical protein